MELAAARPLQPAKGAFSKYLGDAIWAARVIAALVMVLAAGVLPTMWHQLAFLIGLAVLTYPVRSARWGLVYDFFLFGMLFSTAIIGLQFVIERLILGGQHPLLGSVFVAPLTEETLKVFPLVVALLIVRLGIRYTCGAADLMLCGAALGSGFGFVEDALRHTRSFPPPATPHLFGFAVFRDSYNGFIGHGGSTAIIALTIGWLLYAMRWKKTVLVGWIIVAIATYWMMVDHALANYQVSTSSANWLFPIRWMWRLDRHGALSPYVAFAAIVLTIVVERLLLWRDLRPIPRMRIAAIARFVQSPLRAGLSYGSLRQMVVHCRSLLVYILTFRQLGFLGGRLRGDRPINRQRVATLIRRRTGEVIAMQAAVRRA